MYAPKLKEHFHRTEIKVKDFALIEPAWNSFLEELFRAQLMRRMLKKRKGVNAPPPIDISQESNLILLLVQLAQEYYTELEKNQWIVNSKFFDTVNADLNPLFNFNKLLYEKHKDKFLNANLFVPFKSTKKPKIF